MVMVIFKVLMLVLLIFLLPKDSYAHQGNIHQVIIKDDSFKPDTLEITQGEKVEFTNDSLKDHWPASNIHPTHGIYPEFDPRQSIKPGKSWTFTFTKPGSWRYHDHLNPSLTGTIIVSKTDNQSNTIVEENLNFADWDLKAYFLRFYYLLFPDKLYSKLDSLNSVELVKNEKALKHWLIILGGSQLMDKLIFDTEGGSKVDCHQEAHLIGRTAFAVDKAKVFQKINYGCHSGFLHGALEGFIKSSGNQDIVKAVYKLCNTFQTSFTKFECLHGIGHGFTAYTDYDIPEGLGLCKSLPDDYARRSCFGGIFMENIMVAEGKGATPNHESKWINSDPHFPCNKVEQDPLVQYECYQMQTSRMLHLSNYNFGQIVSWCLKAPENMIPVCFRSMGRDIAGQTLRSPDGIISNCQASPREFFHECLTGAVNVVIDFWGEKLSDQPHQICKKLISNSDKSFCYQLIGTRLKDIFEDLPQIEKICRMSEGDFVDICLKSAKVTQTNIPKPETQFFFNWQTILFTQVVNWLQNQQNITQVIKITPDGFDPDKLTINVGLKIAFENIDSKPHWPASDFHPTHELYPEFDPQQSIEPGKSWEFEFKKPGQWKYHDHLNPHVKAEILVSDQTPHWVDFFSKSVSFIESLLPKKAALAIPNTPHKIPAKVEFLKLSKKDQQSLIQDIASEQNLKTIWDFVIDTFKDQPQDIIQAHDLAHLLGGLIYDHEGIEGLPICTPDFAYGCYHGLLDKAFASDTSKLQQAEEACLKLGKENSGPFASCVHGIGHGLASFHKSKELLPSLKACDRLKSGQIFCYDGVFMEFARSAHADFYDQNNPLYPCDQLDEVYSATCGRNQPMVMLGRFKFDFNKIALICSHSQNLSFKNACFDSLGFYSVTASEGVLENISQMCLFFNNLDFANHCLRSAAGELVFQKINGWQEKWKKLCSLSSDTQALSSCTEYVEKLIQDYTR